MSAALSIDRVVKRFGAFTAVDGISLTVPRGAVYGVLGPNGAGKTTTIRMIMNILRPDEGSIEVLGLPSGEEVKSRVGYLPEERGIYKKMKVEDLVTYFGVLKGMSSSAARERGRQLLGELGLGDWLQAKGNDLSKGMQQKVQFASTIVHDPELVILDEPFSGLDPVATEALKDRVLELKRQGTTVLFSTHIMDQAEKLCDSVVLIDRGQKVLDGTLDEVRRSAVAEEAVIVEFAEEGVELRGLPGVERVGEFGRHQEVFLAKDADPDAFLRTLQTRGSIRRFEVRRPSLHQIFLRAVGREQMTPAPVAGEAVR